MRYFHPGEGNYAETEDVIRSLLGLEAGAARAARPEGGAAGTRTRSSGTSPRRPTSGPSGAAWRRTGSTPTRPSRAQLHVPALAGTWQAEPQRIRSVSPEASLSLEYLAREVNLVMATGVPGGAPIDVTVELDGKPLPEGYRTADTRVDADGRTYVQVQASDLYRLVLGPRVEQHTVRLTPRTPGLEAFAYTFGSLSAHATRWCCSGRGSPRSSPPASCRCCRPTSGSSPAKPSMPGTPPGPFRPRCCSCWASPSSSPASGPPPGSSARP